MAVLLREVIPSELDRNNMQYERPLVWLTVLGILSCSSATGFRVESAGCDGKKCQLIGLLEVLPGGYGAGSIETSTGCYDLALPKSVLDAPGHWNRKPVRLTGALISRPAGDGIAWYQIRDRRVESGGCGASIIYVESIEQASHGSER